MKALPKLLRWWLYTGLFSIIPLIAAYIFSASKSGKLVPLGSVISHGELFLVASAMCAAGAGEVFGTGKTWVEAKLVAGGFSLAIIALATFLFAMASVSTDLDQNFTFWVSFWVFVSAWVVSSSCIALSEIV